MNVKTTPKRFRSITVCSDTGGPFSLLYLGRVFLLLFSDTLYRVAFLLPYPFWFFRYNEQREKGRNVQIWGILPLQRLSHSVLRLQYKIRTRRRFRFLLKFLSSSKWRGVDNSVGDIWARVLSKKDREYWHSFVPRLNIWSNLIFCSPSCLHICPSQKGLKYDNYGNAFLLLELLECVIKRKNRGLFLKNTAYLFLSYCFGEECGEAVYYQDVL